MKSSKKLAFIGFDSDAPASVDVVVLGPKISKSSIVEFFYFDETSQTTRFTSICLCFFLLVSRFAQLKHSLLIFFVPLGKATKRERRGGETDLLSGEMLDEMKIFSDDKRDRKGKWREISKSRDTYRLTVSCRSSSISERERERTNVQQERGTVNHSPFTASKSKSNPIHHLFLRVTNFRHRNAQYPSLRSKVYRYD